MKRFILLILLFVSLGVTAQTYTLQDFFSTLQDDEHAGNDSWLAQMEEYAYLHAHPVDINTATKEDFEKLPTLSDKQIEDIHTYVVKHQGMRSLGELMAIPSLNYTERNVISLFFYAGQRADQRRDSVTFKNLVKQSQHEFIARLDVPLYERQGYATSPVDGGYYGSKLYNKVVYRMESMNHVQAGFLGEKDQGEPFRGHRGYDNYSGFFLVKNVKCLRTAVVGDYRLGFGEGLVVNNGYSIGKSAVFNTIKGVRPNTSTDELKYLRGAAVTMHWANIDFTAWVSKRKIDATLDSDGDVRTLLTSGTHRTNSELARRHNLGSLMTGGDVTWSAHGVKLGATGYYQHFSLPLSPGTSQYRTYYPSGSKFGILGVHYGYGNSFLTFAGETAYSTEKQGLATINKLVWRINTKYKLSAVQRYYQKQYYSFYATALSDNSNVQNETGGMLKFEGELSRHWNVTAYADFFHNPWPRYNTTASTTGQDLTFIAGYKLNDHHSLTARYQFKHKLNADSTEIHHRIRLVYTASPTSSLRLQSIANLHAVKSGAGFSLSQNVRYNFRHKGCYIASVLSYFNTPNYASRVYINEPSLHNSFSYPALYGHGLRNATAGSYSFLHQRIILEGRFGVTCYFDRTTQSSGMQTIHSRWKSDLALQLRLKI